MAETYGLRNEDGTVTVYDQATHQPLYTESWEQNQGISAAAPASPYPQVDVGGYYTQQLQLQAAQSAANQAYLAERLRLLELPEMEARTELDRHQLALQAAIALAEQTGWIKPGDVQAAGFLAGGISNSVGQQISGPDVMVYNTVNGYRTVQQLRDELRVAGYGNWENADASELAQVYGRTAGGSVTPVGYSSDAVKAYMDANPDIRAWAQQGGHDDYEGLYLWATKGVQERTAQTDRWKQAMDVLGIGNFGTGASTGGVTTGDENLGQVGEMPWNRTVPGAQQTMAGATVAAAPGRFENNLQMLGVQPGQVPTNVDPGAVPTLQLKEMMANPANMPASLMALGNTSQQAAQFLGNTPYVQGLTGGNPAATGESGFGFISGRQLPVRQTLADIQGNSQKIPLLQGLFAFSGQNPGEEFGEFSQYLPRGGANPLTRFA